MKENCLVALDLGGTWIKGASAAVGENLGSASARKWRNPLRGTPRAEVYADQIASICEELAAGRKILAIACATAGEIDASGQSYLHGGDHLGVMLQNDWLKILSERLHCRIWLINDAEAFLAGAAELNRLPRTGNVAGLVIGTGLGFSVVRDGRWWKPDRRLNLLGSLWHESGRFDQWAGAASRADAEGSLRPFLEELQQAEAREKYFDGLARVIANATILHRLDSVLLGGGLVDACCASNAALEEILSPLLPRYLPGWIQPPSITSLPQAEAASLRGAMALAKGNFAGEAVRRAAPLNRTTESPAHGPGLETLPAEEIVAKLCEAERAAANDLLAENATIGAVAEQMADGIQNGGRVIYVGAGTSGRVGALDAVEIPCTFGAPRSQFVSIVAGGMADAAIHIESNSEEDFSAVPEMLPLGIDAKDIVIAISASGGAFFARSALAFAREKGARTVFIHESDVDMDCDWTIRLRSGSELIGGSTRMKAGTATKKILNFLSTTAMIRLGKVRGGYMIAFDCCNEKLRSRAEQILCQLEGVELQEARDRLREHGYVLPKALRHPHHGIASA